MRVNGFFLVPARDIELTGWLSGAGRGEEITCNTRLNGEKSLEMACQILSNPYRQVSPVLGHVSMDISNSALLDAPETTSPLFQSLIMSIFQLNKNILSYQNVEYIFRFLVKQKQSWLLNMLHRVWIGFHGVLSLHD